jgi:hypothetical protein
MMPGTMTEQHARDARAPHEPPVHLTFAEAGERLGISANAVRMRVHRGSLASIRVNERTFVVWPQPAQPHAQRTHDARDERAEDRDALVAQLRDENAYLRQQLDHQTHIIAGLVQRLQELPAGEPSQEMPQERAGSPRSDDNPTVAPDSLVGRLRRLMGRGGR